MCRLEKHVLFYALSIVSLNVSAQPDLKFERYTTNQGLVHNDVLCIAQDTLGFMWFGTKHGCSRFDGMEFKNYHYNENVPRAIGEGWVNKIVRDDENNLWFAIAGSDNTLVKFDYETGQFTDVSSFIKTKLNIGDEAFNVWSVFCDSDGIIWLFAINLGLIQYNPESREVKSFSNHIDASSIMRDALEDNNHNIWFVTSKGLFIYSKKTYLFTICKNNSNNITSISSDNCYSIFQDSENSIWVGTNFGLNKVVKSSGVITFERFVHEPYNSYSLSNSLVHDIAEDANGSLLIATVNGLYLMNRKDKKVYAYYNDERDNESINSNIVRSVYCDKYKNIWIGTSSGIGKLQIKNFKTFSHSFYKNSISSNKVEYLCEDPNSNVWIATPKGIDVLNRKSGQFQQILTITQNSRGLYGIPIALHPDVNKGIWIGTYNGGLSYFNYASRKITNYITDSTVRLPGNIFSVFKDSKNNLWLDSQGEGIAIYNLETKEYRFLSYNKDKENSLNSKWNRIIKEDSDSNIWIGTINGLNKLVDFKTGTFKRYLEGIEIYCIVEASDKCLWFGTNRGLYQLNKLTRQFKRYASLDQLSNVVFGIVEDENRNLWITTDKELIKFKLNENAQAGVTIYRKEEGVAVGNFIPRSYVKLSDGSIAFGGTEGFLMFHPDEVKEDTVSPSVVFTGLKVANREVRVGQKINNQIVLQTSIATTQYLILNHKNNAFAIKSAGLHHNMSQYYQYCYRLEGYDPSGKEWHYANSNDREVEYMNLPKGSYIFKVKAANSYGIWSKMAQLKITILPPWWQTVWFRTLLLAAIITFFILILRIRTYNLQKQKQRLKKIVEKRTMELREMNSILIEQKGQLEQQIKKTEEIAQQLHNADQSKLRFFSNISHEFRTPLTLIIGPLERILFASESINWKNVNVINHLTLMYKNAKRLLRLVNQIIDFRKLDQGQKKISLSNNNISEFVNEIVEAFRVLAEQKNITLNLESQYPVIDFNFDTDVIEKILYNLISNAIKYTPEGGEVSIQLSVNNQQLTVNSNQLSDIHSSFLIIKVSDTGIGISKENLDKIFDRFYRVDSDETYLNEGTGIGLAYAKELVELHGGKIIVESEKNKGTVFMLLFPIGKENSVEITSSKSFNLNFTKNMIKEKQEEVNEKEPATMEPDFFVDHKIKANVLIIEDNPDIQSFISNELNGFYTIEIANDGQEGFEIAIQNIPDLIISDIMMPRMNGIELSKKLKNHENTSHIPIILLTAKTGDDNTIEGLKTGADDYITKPFNVDILKLKIHNLLTSRNHLREKINKSIETNFSDISITPIDEKFIKKAIEIVETNMSDSNFSNDTFVNAMGYGRTLVYKKIKALTSHSVSEFIRSIRMKKAARLLLEGEKTVSEISILLGFKHREYFYHQFSGVFGKSPSQFVKEHTRKK